MSRTTPKTSCSAELDQLLEMLLERAATPLTDCAEQAAPVSTPESERVNAAVDELLGASVKVLAGEVPASPVQRLKLPPRSTWTARPMKRRQSGQQLPDACAAAYQRYLRRFVPVIGHFPE